MNGSRHPLARVLAAVINAHEEEGARVSRLLHDEVGQILSAVGLHLDVLRMDVEESSPEIARRIVENQKILEQAVDQVRALSYELNPEVVERAGLQAALDRLVGRYREISKQPIRLLFDSSIRLPMRSATALYKIAECALDNAVKHSGCEKVEVLVQRRRGGVELRVRDDGVGFDPESAVSDPDGLGLLLMSCYADQGEVKLDIKSTAGNGTIVRVRHPLAAAT